MKKTILLFLMIALSVYLLLISCAGDEDTVLVVGNIPSDYITDVPFTLE